MNRNYYITKLKEKRTALFAFAMAVLFVFVFSAQLRAGAEPKAINAWIMCQPGDWVNVRAGASRKSASLGMLEAGDKVTFTGETKNGFLKVRVALEESEGWIYAGYVTDQEPVNMGGADYVVETSGRVACRKCIHGERRCWVVDGSRVRVWWMNDEWAVTNKGFIQSQYLRRWE